MESNEYRNKLIRLRMAAVAVPVAMALAPNLWPASTDPAPTFTKTNLVSDVPGMAKTTDPNLVNPWGMALGTNSGIWISENGSGKATTYDGAGQPIPAGSPQVVTIPTRGGGKSAPTGVATNA